MKIRIEQKIQILILYIFILIFLPACRKKEPEIVIPKNLEQNTPVVISFKTVTVTSTKFNNNITFLEFRNYPNDSTFGFNESSNGTVYYNDNILISPGTGHYMYPIHLIKKDSLWILKSIHNDSIIDRPRNIYKVDDKTYVWANAGTESQNNPTGNLYLSKNNLDNSINWKRISNPNQGEFYHYAASGDIDGDGDNDILTFVGVETESPEQFKLLTAPSFNSETINFPTAKEFEIALGFTDSDRRYVGAGFSFGSITVANIDKTTPESELILTSTKVKMNEYYSFIIMKYDATNHKFLISKIIKAGGALLDNKMAVSDVKFGDFNNDNNIDIVVAMGDYKNNSGIQVWYNDGKGNLTPDKNKKELYGKTYGNEIYYSSFEVGQYHGNNCIFLHYESSRYDPRPQAENGVDLNPFFLINKGDKGGFVHESIIPFQTLGPAFVKGYFEKQNGVDVLRLIGIRNKVKQDFYLSDITIK
jgi:hypothetical protein